MEFGDPLPVDVERGYSAGLTDALKRLRQGRRGKATDDDRPPPSTFPPTSASRQAMRIVRENRRLDR